MSVEFQRSGAGGVAVAPMAGGPLGFAALDGRRLAVLRILVQEHVRSGAPVSSAQVARRHRERLSPATIRSVMAELTEQGYLTQPHTSAGRAPTDKGYRAVVDEVLSRDHRVSRGEAQQIESLLRSPGAAEDVLAAVSRLLGRLTNQVGVVLAPDVACAPLASVDLVRVAPRRVVVVFVEQSGLVLHRVAELNDDLTQEELDEAGRRLREQLCGLTWLAARERLTASLQEDRSWADRVGRRVACAMALVLGSPPCSASGLIVAGASRLLEAPEFADVGRLRDALRAIEDKTRLLPLLERCLGGPRVQAIIGSETADAEMAALAVVASPYRAGGLAPGLVGVLGPRRMEYARAVALVGHVARAISAWLSAGAGRGAEA